MSRDFPKSVRGVVVDDVVARQRLQFGTTMRREKFSKVDMKFKTVRERLLKYLRPQTFHKSLAHGEG